MVKLKKLLDTKDAPETSSEKENAAAPEQDARQKILGGDRTHFEGLGMPFAVLLGAPPQKLINQVVATCMGAGGSRPAWSWKRSGNEYHVMAWPKEEPVRAAVLVGGKEKEKLSPLDCFPLIEGLPNDLTVDSVHAWQQGMGANVAAFVEEGYKPMWFYDPMYNRDKDDLTPGVKQTFLVGALAFALKKALLDNLTITQGPYYEEYAARWLEEHPGSSRLDVPPLQIKMAGQHIIMPGHNYCEYQMRTSIDQIEDHKLDKMEVKILYVRFPFEGRDPVLLPIYASKAVLKDYEPKVGDEIDAYVWLQGRIIDIDDTTQPVPEGFVADTKAEKEETAKE